MRKANSCHFLEFMGFDVLKYPSSFLEGKNMGKIRGSKRGTEAVMSLMNVIWLESYNLQNQNHVGFVLCLLFAVFFDVITEFPFFKKPKCFLYGFHIKPSESILLSTDTLCFLLILFQPDCSVSEFPLTFWSLLKNSFLRNLNFPDVRDFKTSSVLVVVSKCWHNM